ncbi:MAG: MFS transporter [Clostridia bacterium]|nr:MFS transporter [Clostridia bacterium]
MDKDQNPDEGTGQRIVLIVACVAAFITPFMTSSINLAIVDISQQFQANSFLSGWVVNTYLLAAAAFLLPLGRLSDMIGRKKIFTLGMFIFFLATLLCALSWSIETLLAFRFVQGLGCSMIFGTAIAILTSAYPPQSRGKVLGINVACVYLGLSLGPIFGGVLNHNFGWQSIFWFVVLLSLIALLASLIFLKQDWRDNKEEKFDFIGSGLYCLGTTALLFGIMSLFDLNYGKYSALAGLFLLLTFLAYEYRQEYPILNVKLFSHNTVFIFSNLASLINYSSTFAVTYLISVYLQVVVCLNSQISGFIMLSQPIFMAVLSPLAGRLSDRLEPRILASLGMALITVGLFIFSFLQNDTSLIKIIISLAFIGIGCAFFSSPNTNSVMSSVENRYMGIASSTLSVMRLSGQAFSMSFVTMFLAIYLGGTVELSQANPDSVVTAAQVSFRVFAVLCLLGVFASYARGKLHQAQE